MSTLKQTQFRLTIFSTHDITSDESTQNGPNWVEFVFAKNVNIAIILLPTSWGQCGGPRPWCWCRCSCGPHSGHWTENQVKTFPLKIHNIKRYLHWPGAHFSGQSWQRWPRPRWWLASLWPRACWHTPGCWLTSARHSEARSMGWPRLGWGHGAVTSGPRDHRQRLRGCHGQWGQLGSPGWAAWAGGAWWRVIKWSWWHHGAHKTPCHCHQDIWHLQIRMSLTSAESQPHAAQRHH